MLKKILIMSMLLISGLNAENSLAEEAAFKKQQEQRAIQQQELEKQKNEKEAREVIIPRIKKFNAFSTHVYEKYFVKASDTPEVIDNKYRNRVQLFKELGKDLIISNNEFTNLAHIINDSNWEVSKVVNSIEDVNLSALFSSNSWKEQGNYLSANFSGGVSIEKYTEYLEDAYNSCDKGRESVQQQNELEIAPAARQFNSLAEEAAFKKQQEQLAIQQQELQNQKDKQDVEKIIIPRIKDYNNFSTRFYEKYFIKKNDTKDIIDNKYKNRVQLYQSMQIDFILLETEYDKLYKMIRDNNYIKDASKSSGLYLAGLLSDDSWSEAGKNHLSSCMAPYKEYKMNYNLFSPSIDEESGGNYPRDGYGEAGYEQYLRCTFESYEDRQKEAKKQQEDEIRYAQMNKKSEMERAQAKKQQQLSLANEKKKRQRVQGACQAWRVKANKMVYSLGVGDQIIYYWSFGDMRGSSTSVIRGLNANTFLIVNSIGRNEYVAKNSSIAYDALKTAPSPYCYQ